MSLTLLSHAGMSCIPCQEVIACAKLMCSTCDVETHGARSNHAVSPPPVKTGQSASCSSRTNSKRHTWQASIYKCCPDITFPSASCVLRPSSHFPDELGSILVQQQIHEGIWHAAHLHAGASRVKCLEALTERHACARRCPARLLGPSSFA